MNKYTPLEEFLKRQTGNSVVLSFAQIEEIINDKLPLSAHRWFRFWENGPGTVQSDAWHNAGFETVMVDRENEKVKFQQI